MSYKIFQIGRCTCLSGHKFKSAQPISTYVASKYHIVFLLINVPPLINAPPDFLLTKLQIVAPKNV